HLVSHAHHYDLSATAPPHRLSPFPTRRSSDLLPAESVKTLLADGDTRWINQGSYDLLGTNPGAVKSSADLPRARVRAEQIVGASDRKSTRLNSSHQIISYAVFCLKKKKI